MNKTVLIIEDDESIIAYIKKLLILNGYTAYCAGNAKEAINLFKDDKINIDLAIADFSLSQKSGIETIEELKAIKPGFKIIITGVYSNNSPNLDIIKEKGYKYIQKPFGMSEFITAVRETLKAVTPP